MPSSEHESAEPLLPPDGIRLLHLTDRDLDQVLAIEERSFPSPWRRKHFEFELRENPYSESYVARHGRRVLGYAGIWRLDDEFKINNFAVLPEERRKGLGVWMLRGLLGRARQTGCRRATLEVRASNRAAIRLYESEGFLEAGRRKNYYQLEHEDAILMSLDL